MALLLKRGFVYCPARKFPPVAGHRPGFYRQPGQARLSLFLLLSMVRAAKEVVYMECKLNVPAGILLKVPKSAVGESFGG